MGIIIGDVKAYWLGSVNFEVTSKNFSFFSFHKPSC
uniref:Uncharacterized protein n=1 Tax=Anguilla anguilla TaxID=7936 RepID=A0A0E9QXU4_ANGAN